MSSRTLNSIEGFSNDIGFCLSGMEEVRAQLDEAVAGMSAEQLGRLAVPGAHSIAALILHIGEAEWYWMRHVFSGDKVTDEIRNAPYWDVLKDPARISQKGYSAEYCLNEIKKIRRQTYQTLAPLQDSKLDEVFSVKRKGEMQDLTLRWMMHHLIDHEAQHKGQILMLKRLLG